MLCLAEGGGGDFPMGIRLLSLCFNEVTVMTGCGRRFTAAVFIYGVLRAGNGMLEHAGTSYKFIISS